MKNGMIYGGVRITGSSEQAGNSLSPFPPIPTHISFTLLGIVELSLYTAYIAIVRELMGWVRNVVLIKCIFGSGKPKGGRDFGWEGKWAR
jgi:hypothetical protein